MLLPCLERSALLLLPKLLKQGGARRDTRMPSWLLIPVGVVALVIFRLLWSNAADRNQQELIEQIRKAVREDLDEVRDEILEELRSQDERGSVGSGGLNDH